VKAGDDTDSWVMVIGSLPVLVSVAVCVAFWPTGISAKVMFAGLICTLASGVELAFEVFAKPAQPLGPAPPHETIANNPVTIQPLLVLVANCFPAVPLVSLAILFLSGHPVREADYGFDSYSKYWRGVQLRDRCSPVRLNIALTSTFSDDFLWELLAAALRCRTARRDRCRCLTLRPLKFSRALIYRCFKKTIEISICQCLCVA
jgi:hypothetical protein